MVDFMKRDVDARKHDSIAGTPPALARPAVHRRPRRVRGARRGVVTLWLIVTLPVLLLLVCFVVEIGNIWLARVELENALESAALAAVQEWADTPGNIPEARNVGVEYAKANLVTGAPVVLTANGGGSGANQNATCAGGLVFGAITSGTIPSVPWVFNAGTPPSSPSQPFAVLAQANVPVTSVCSSFLGASWGPFSVSGSVVAMADGVALPHLIRVQPGNIVCPGP